MFTSKNILASVATGVFSFCAGALAFAYFSGSLGDAIDPQQEANWQLAFDQGYAEALAASPRLVSEKQALNIISSAIFVNSIEIELKDISRQNNAIEFTYGEVGRDRFHVAELEVGHSIAQQFGNNLYIIRHISVYSNLQRATLEVVKVLVPDNH